jgi:hypothetical protein
MLTSAELRKKNSSDRNLWFYAAGESKSARQEQASRGESKQRVVRGGKKIKEFLLVLTVKSSCILMRDHEWSLQPLL